MAGKASNVPGFEDHLSGQTPLDCEVNRVAAAHLKLWVVLEAQNFAQSISWYDWRGHCARSRRSRNRPVHSNTEARETRIGSRSGQGNACVTALDTCPVGVAEGCIGVYGLSESNSQHRDDHALHRIHPVIRDSVAASNNRFPVAENAAEETAPQTWMPRGGYARSPVAVVHTEDIATPAFANWDVGKRWVENISI